jgi:hypothetical protein
MLNLFTGLLREAMGINSEERRAAERAAIRSEIEPVIPTAGSPSTGYASMPRSRSSTPRRARSGSSMKDASH